MTRNFVLEFFSFSSFKINKVGGVMTNCVGFLWKLFFTKSSLWHQIHSKIHCSIIWQEPKNSKSLKTKSVLKMYLSFDLHILTQKCIVYSRHTWHILGWDIVWKIHQQHNGDYKTFLVLNSDQLVKSQISCSEPVALLLCQVYQTIKDKSGGSQS